MRFPTLIGLMMLPLGVFAQVNFEKGPENTDCHQISGDHSTEADYVKAITTRRFRFTETLTISRYRSPRRLEYFSCDGKSGYLVAVTGDTTAVLHENVPLSVWQAFTDQRDILDYYAGEFSRLYPPWHPE